jgi:hypothetical protein
MRYQTHLPLQTPHHPRGQVHSIVPRQLPRGKSLRYLMSFRRPHQIPSFHPKSQMHHHFHPRKVYPRANAMMDPANCLQGSAVPVRYFTPFLMGDPPDLSNFLLGATPEFRRLLSRSSPRPPLASVNVLLLHPATLRPVSERHTSTHSSSRSVAGHVADPDDADSLSTLPSSMPTTYPQDISQLPSFPETAANPSAATSSGFPSSSSPQSSPDFLDSIILAEESGRTRREHSLLSINHSLLTTISIWHLCRTAHLPGEYINDAYIWKHSNLSRDTSHLQPYVLTRFWSPAGPYFVNFRFVDAATSIPKKS